jgi:hypothetical protein
MELVATLLTDMPLDERRFHGMLLDIADSCLAGAIAPCGLEARHSFGEADRDEDVRDIHVIVKPPGSAPAAARHELAKAGFRPRCCIEFLTYEDPDSREEAWALVNLYARELSGWVLTRYVDFDEARRRCGDDRGLLHVPLSCGSESKAVLVAATTMKVLAP